MAREGITQAQVYNAADAISAAGQNPTVASIRAKLGTGSFTTITAHLRSWKDQAITSVAPESDVPEEVTAALARAAEIVWKAAQDHFARELAALRKAADEATLKAYQEADEARTEIENLENQIEDQANQVKARDTKIDNLSNELKNSENEEVRLRQERAELRAELKAADARIKEQADLLRRLVPEKAKGPTTARKKRTTDEPEIDTLTKPLEI